MAAVTAPPDWPCGLRFTVTNGVSTDTYVPAQNGYLYIRRVRLAVAWAGTSPWGLLLDDGGGASVPVTWSRTSPGAGNNTDETWYSPVWHPGLGSAAPPSASWSTFPTAPGVWVEPNINEGAYLVFAGNTYTCVGSFAFAGYNGTLDFIFSTKAPAAFLVANDDPCFRAKGYPRAFF